MDLATKGGLMRSTATLGALTVGLVLAGASARAATVTVNDATDVIHQNPSGDNCRNTGSGTCSLRDAILYLNDQPAGPHTIQLSGVASVTLSNALGSLPVVTAQLTLDGTTAPGARFEIKGSNLAGGATGLRLSGQNCLIKAVVVNSFPGSGIEVQSGGKGCTIQDSYIGTDPTGAMDMGNGDYGVIVNANTLVPPPVSLINNVISGNGQGGVQIIGTNTLGTILTNNKIGTDVSGMNDLGNDLDGVIIQSGSDATQFAGGNVISGNGRHGIWVQANVNVTGMVISGNFIGMSLGGLSAIPNDMNGVYLDGDVTLSTVGPGNVISGNDGHGVVLHSADTNIVVGNIIGLDAGFLGAGNGGDGVRLETGADDNIVGGPLGPDPSLIRNIIGSNAGAGVRITSQGAQTFGNAVQGNYVGTDPTNLASLPNAVGIVVEGSSSFDITIGGGSDQESNVVANNTGPGIQIGTNVNDSPGPVTILRNVVYANGGLGIDLDNDGVTPNDAGDGDIGSNELQNYPVATLALVSTTSGQVILRGTQDSRPGLQTQLQFFRAEPDPTGFGEGKELILDVPGAGTGNFTFGTAPSSPPVAISPGDAVSITATTVQDGTSEFSANATFVANQLPVANAGPNQTVGVNSPVTLDGSASNDPDGLPDGNAIQSGRFTWAQTMGPAVVLSNSNTANPSFTPSMAGTYVFSLVVNDGLDDSTNQASVTITVSDFGSLQFSTAAYMTNEGAGTATLTVTRTGGSFGAVGVDYAVTGGTATPGSDFTVAAGTLNWADGDSASKTILVTILDDLDPAEPDETVEVSLSNAGGGASLGAPSLATLSIADNDIPGTLQFNSATSTVNEAAGSAMLTVDRTGGSFGAVSIDYAVTGGTATPGSDFTLAAGTLNWADGDMSSKTILVTNIDDSTPAEPNETVEVTLTNPGGSATLGNPALTTLTIVDDDVPGTLQFASATYTANEDAGTATLTVNRTGGSDGAVAVDFSVTGGTAAAGSDFTLVAGTLNWADGDMAPKTITVTLIDDIEAAEPNETVEVTLSNATGGATIGAPATTTLTIVDDDVPGTLQFDMAAYTANEADGTATLTVTRAGGSDGNVSVDYMVTGGTATPGSDFTLAAGTLNWANGDATPKTIVVTLIDDPVVGEPNETVDVTLSNAGGGAAIGAPASTTLTIVDNDIPQPGSLQFALATYMANEGDGTATLTVTRAGGSDGAVSVDYMVTGGTATSGTDFSLAAGTLNWADGDSSSKSITVTVFDDPTPGEPDETVIVTVSNAGGGATVGALATTTLTIVDNDPIGTLQFDSAAYSVAESGVTATVTVTRVGGSSGMVTVDYTTSDGTATVGGMDYQPATGTISWADGDASSKTFTVTILDDPTIEGDETVDLTLSNPGGGATLGSPSAAVLTIVDDDGTPADLAITKSSFRANVTPGRRVTYTIVVTNPGPVSLTGVTVSDPPPAELLNVTWTCAAAGGATCAASGAGAINDTVDVPLGGTLTYKMTGTLDPAASGTLVNTATIVLPPGFGDTNPADNIDSDITQVVPAGVKDDFDGDGNSDLVLYNTSTGQVDIWLMNGIAVGMSGTAGAMPDPNWQIVSGGDYDGDGRGDILWHNGSTGDALVWFMNGTMVAGAAAVGGFPDLNWTVGASGDFDADGKFDIAWRNAATGEVHLWLMDGVTIAGQATVGVSAAPIAAAGDYDADGLADLLVRGGGGGTTVWFLNGLSLLGQSPTSVTLADPNFQVVGSGDHNGDFQADVLWHNMTTGGKLTWLMNGATVQSQGPPGGALRAHPEVAGTGDYDGDGRADIAWQNRTTARVFVWLMNGLAVTSQGFTGLLPGPGSVWKVVRIK
jgi:uncharacterized repeat protein (TIGR01451 family)